jgi:hypothetical protein
MVHQRDKLAVVHEVSIMAASNLQIQQFVDQRIRPHAELARQLALVLDSDIASIDDVYNALNVPSPTWTDSRTDGPPHLLTPSDVLAINTFMHDIRDAIKNHPQWPIVQKACVHAPLG